MKIPKQQPISIAVLPFKSIGAGSDQIFIGEGISEEIINGLTKISQLRVISKNSSFLFKDQTLEPSAIGKKLEVSILLTGSIQILGQSMKISTQLIQAEENHIFWSESWNRSLENVFAVQDEISIQVADTLREHVGHLDVDDQLVDKPAKDIDAYQCYLKGRHLSNQWNAEGNHLAIQEYNKAISLDPNLINGYIGLADSYSFLAVAGFAPREESWAKSVENMEIAKRLDPGHFGLNYMLANHAFFTEADFAGALHYARKSLKSNPTFAQSHQLISFLFSISGRQKKSQKHILYAKSIDPLNPETLYFLAYHYYRIEAYDQAQSIVTDLLKGNDRNIPALMLNVYIHLKKEEWKKAQDQIEQVPLELFTPNERLGLRALLDAHLGKDQTTHLTELIENAKDPSAYHAHSYLYMTYVVLRKIEEALSVLNNLFTHKSSILLLSFDDPICFPIKGYKGYQDLLAKIYPINKNDTSITAPRKKMYDPQKMQGHLNQLNEYVKQQAPYLNPKLTLRTLAQEMGIHPNQLSFLINEFMGKNFNEYINFQRIEHFKTIAVDPSNAHISIMGLAYESGFNSKTVFNTVFKKVVGMTPKTFQLKFIKNK